ncbi:hypothetical protein [Morganella phage Mecenats66]|nr:hypothetical protein [Morganella phage Mecenats66]
MTREEWIKKYGEPADQVFDKWFLDHGYAAEDPDYDIKYNAALAGWRGRMGLMAHDDNGLHPDTMELVMTFAGAMARKLRQAEIKHGFTDNWKNKGWHADLIDELYTHCDEGSPVDVANYCAFAYYHGWSIGPVPRPAVMQVPEAAEPSEPPVLKTAEELEAEYKAAHPEELTAPAVSDGGEHAEK